MAIRTTRSGDMFEVVCLPPTPDDQAWPVYEYRVNGELVTREDFIRRYEAGQIRRRGTMVGSGERG